MSRPPLILDACVVLNLAATDRMLEILRAYEGPFGAASIIPEREPLILDAQPVDFTGIPLLEMTDAEMEHFVELTAGLGDGESATLAIASARSAVPVTDDRKAINLWNRISSGTIIGTPDLMRCWADSQSVTPFEVSLAIRAIENRARFRPGRRHADYARWVEMLG